MLTVHHICSDNPKNSFSILVESPTDGIKERFGSQEKNFNSNFSKWNRNFCFTLYYNANNTYLFVNGKEIFTFKAENKNANFPTQFCLGIISNRFSATESREVSLNGNMYDF